MAKKNRQLAALVRENLPKAIDAIKGAQEAEGSLDGAGKLDFAVAKLNAVIDIPYLPEWIEEMIFKAVLTTIVELARHKWGEKDWFEKLVE